MCACQGGGFLRCDALAVAALPPWLVPPRLPGPHAAWLLYEMPCSQSGPATSRLGTWTAIEVDSSAAWLQIYICGGCSDASWQWGALSCTPSSGEWGALPDMPGIHAFGASASVGQTVYVMGGSTTGSQEDWSASVIRWVPCVAHVLLC